jgi:hypothetical protein
MCIVYVYFSKAAVAGESLVAILLCMGVAAFDVILLVMRWLWFEQYINYGSVVLHVFQVYRVVVLPVANTWMSWSLLNKMDVTPSYGVIALLGVLLMTFVVLGVQVRFFLHAPLQLASVLFAATSTPDICGLFFESTSSLRCIGIVSALQLTLGLVLPSAMVYFLESRSGRCFMPHMQAKLWLPHPQRRRGWRGELRGGGRGTRNPDASGLAKPGPRPLRRRRLCMPWRARTMWRCGQLLAAHDTARCDGRVGELWWAGESYYLGALAPRRHGGMPLPLACAVASVASVTTLSRITAAVCVP